MLDRGRKARRHKRAVRTSLGILGALTLILTGAFATGIPAAASTSGRISQSTSAAPAPAAVKSAASRIASESAAAPTNTPHIMEIIEENEGYSDIIGSSSAPYLNSLANTYGSATKWYAVQHNSPHDYLDLLVGSDLGLPNGKPYSTTTLVDELHSSGIPWQAYMESMPSNCFMGTTSNGLYDPNHNPFHYFTKYSAASGGWCNSANLSSEGVLPYPGSSGLISALNGANAPDFVYIVPNDCDEMHGAASPCASSSNAQLIKAGDNWLSSNLAPVLTSTWFKQNGIVIITWDESANGDSSGCCGLSSPGGHIATLVLTSANAGLGSFTGTGDHYGTLRAIEEAYGVGLLGGSSNAVNGDLTGAFGHSTTGSISGTVTDSVTAAVIAGASVSYSGSKGNGSTTTDSNGNYSFSGLSPGSYTVTASAPGHTTGSSPVTVTAGANATQNFALVPTVGSIGGTVTDAQTAAGIVGASVTCTCGGSATTGTGGTYSITNVTPGNYSVTFSAAGYVSGTVNSVVVSAGHTTTESLALTEDGSITGQVTDSATHAAIAGATVTCTCQVGSATTNGSGSYSFLDVAPSSTYSMTFSANGYASQTVNNVVVTAGHATTESIALVAQPGGIGGNVTDGTASTHPALTGVSVSCTCQAGSISTDTSGNYSFASIAAGTYSLTFTDTGYATLTINNVVVTGGTTTTTNAALIEDGTLKGQVTDATAGGTPLSGATVTCTCQVGSATTDSGGSYSFTDVAPGTYSLTFAKTGYVTQTITGVKVTAGTTTITNTGLIEDGSIGGNVTDLNSGLPVSGVTVTCATCPTTSTTTDPSGNYAFGNVPAGTYSLTFSDTGYVTQTASGTVVNAGATTTVNIVLTDDGGVSGTVTDAQTGLPISGATVTCSTCTTTTATTNGSGQYAFTAVPNGTYSLTFNASGYVPDTISGIPVAGPNSTNENVALTEDGGISGTVTDSSTHAVIANAAVTCTCQGTGTTSNGSGVYAFAQVAPGSYTVTVTATGYTGVTTAPFTVSAGATTTENVQLTSAAKPLKEVESFGKATTAASTTLTATAGTATGSGDLLVLTVKDRSSSLTNVTGVSDSGHNTWTKAASTQNGQADDEIWYVANSASITSVTVTVSGSASVAMTVVDVSGATATPLDRTMTASGSSTAPSTGTTATTAQASEIVVADIGWNSTVTPSGLTAGYTAAPLQQSTVSSNQTGEETAWLVVTTTGVQSLAATLSGSVAWVGAIATFK